MNISLGIRICPYCGQPIEIYKEVRCSGEISPFFVDEVGKCYVSIARNKDCDECYGGYCFACHNDIEWPIHTGD